MQCSSIEALTAPHVDLANLPNPALWDSLCQGLTACLASCDAQTLLSTSSLIISLNKHLTKLHDYTCTAQLFCCIAAATAKATSVQASGAIWQACLPIVESLAIYLPMICLYISDTCLTNIADSFCQLLQLCMDHSLSALQSYILLEIGSSSPMAWWHSWLARTKIAKVTCAQSPGHASCYCQASPDAVLPACAMCMFPSNNLCGHMQQLQLLRMLTC